MSPWDDFINSKHNNKTNQTEPNLYEKKPKKTKKKKKKKGLLKENTTSPTPLKHYAKQPHII